MLRSCKEQEKMFWLSHTYNITLNCNNVVFCILEQVNRYATIFLLKFKENLTHTQKPIFIFVILLLLFLCF